jgi:hypothetical protein
MARKSPREIMKVIAEKGRIDTRPHKQFFGGSHKEGP